VPGSFSSFRKEAPPSARGASYIDRPYFLWYDMTMNALLHQRLEDKRAAAGMNHSEFAAHLGMTRGLWKAVMCGRFSGPGRAFYRAVLLKYPELTPDVLQDIIENGTPGEPDAVKAVIRPMIKARPELRRLK